MRMLKDLTVTEFMMLTTFIGLVLCLTAPQLFRTQATPRQTACIHHLASPRSSPQTGDSRRPSGVWEGYVDVVRGGHVLYQDRARTDSEPRD